jgi:hypothetical protein
MDRMLRLADRILPSEDPTSRNRESTAAQMAAVSAIGASPTSRRLPDLMGCSPSAPETGKSQHDAKNGGGNGRRLEACVHGVHIHDCGAQPLPGRLLTAYGAEAGARFENFGARTVLSGPLGLPQELDWMRRATRTMPALLLFISELRPPVIDGAQLLA